MERQPCGICGLTGVRYHLYMAVSAIQTLSDLTSLLGSRAASVRTTGTLTQNLPALANPDVVVSLGSSASNEITYDASGLLRELQNLQQTGALPAGANSGSATSTLQTDLETVLGVDSTAGRLGGADPAVSSSLSADARSALLNVFAADNSSSETTANQALQELLSRALASLSGLEGASAANAALNASGVLTGDSTDNAQAALDSLSSTRLDLAATALGLNGSNSSGSSTAVASDSATEVFNRLMSSRLEQAVAEADPSRPRQHRTAPINSADVLLSGTSLLGSVADSASAAVDTGDSLTEIAFAAQISPETLVRESIRPVPERAATPATVTTTDGTETTAPAAAATTPAPRTMEDLPQPVAEIASAVTATTSPTVAATTTAASPDSLRQPRYAEIAAAMTMGAAVYRYETSVSATVPPGDVAPEQTVQSIRAAAETKSVR